MKRLRLCSFLGFLVLVLGAFPLAGQGAYLDKGVNGLGLETRLMWAMDQFKGVGVVSGYSIAGILDIGGSLGLTLGELGGEDATDVRAAFDYRVHVLKQAPGVPLSVQIVGSYGLNNVLSDYLDADNATRRGTGYTLGLNLSSNIPLTPAWLIRVSLLADHGLTTYTTTTPIIPAPPPEDPQVTTTVEREWSMYLGGSLGFLFVFPQGATLALQAELRADQDLAVQIHPILALAFPQR